MPTYPVSRYPPRKVSDNSTPKNAISPQATTTSTNTQQQQQQQQPQPQATQIPPVQQIYSPTSVVPPAANYPTNNHSTSWNPSQQQQQQQQQHSTGPLFGHTDISNTYDDQQPQQIQSNNNSQSFEYNAVQQQQHYDINTSPRYEQAPQPMYEQNDAQQYDNMNIQQYDNIHQDHTNNRHSYTSDQVGLPHSQASNSTYEVNKSPRYDTNTGQRLDGGGLSSANSNRSTHQPPAEPRNMDNSMLTNNRSSQHLSPTTQYSPKTSSAPAYNPPPKTQNASQYDLPSGLLPVQNYNSRAAHAQHPHKDGQQRHRMSNPTAPETAPFHNTNKMKQTPLVLTSSQQLVLDEMDDIEPFLSYLNFDQNIFPLLQSAQAAYPNDVEPQIYAILDAIDMYFASQDLPAIPALNNGFGYAHEWMAFPARCCAPEFVEKVSKVIEQAYNTDYAALERCGHEIVSRLNIVESSGHDHYTTPDGLSYRLMLQFVIPMLHKIDLPTMAHNCKPWICCQRAGLHDTLQLWAVHGNGDEQWGTLVLQSIRNSPSKFTLTLQQFRDVCQKYSGSSLLYDLDHLIITERKTSLTPADIFREFLPDARLHSWCVSVLAFPEIIESWANILRNDSSLLTPSLALLPHIPPSADKTELLSLKLGDAWQEGLQSRQKVPIRLRRRSSAKSTQIPDLPKLLNGNEDTQIKVRRTPWFSRILFIGLILLLAVPICHEGQDSFSCRIRNRWLRRLQHINPLPRLTQYVPRQVGDLLDTSILPISSTSTLLLNQYRHHINFVWEKVSESMPPSVGDLTKHEMITSLVSSSYSWIGYLESQIELAHDVLWHQASNLSSHVQSLIWKSDGSANEKSSDTQEAKDPHEDHKVTTEDKGYREAQKPAPKTSVSTKTPEPVTTAQNSISSSHRTPIPTQTKTIVRPVEPSVTSNESASQSGTAAESIPSTKGNDDRTSTTEILPSTSSLPNQTKAKPTYDTPFLEEFFRDEEEAETSLVSEPSTTTTTASTSSNSRTSSSVASSSLSASESTTSLASQSKETSASPASTMTEHSSAVLTSTVSSGTEPTSSISTTTVQSGEDLSDQGSNVHDRYFIDEDGVVTDLESRKSRQEEQTAQSAKETSEQHVQTDSDKVGSGTTTQFTNTPEAEFDFDFEKAFAELQGHEPTNEAVDEPEVDADDDKYVIDHELMDWLKMQQAASDTLDDLEVSLDDHGEQHPNRGTEPATEHHVSEADERPEDARDEDIVVNEQVEAEPDAQPKDLPSEYEPSRYLPHDHTDDEPVIGKEPSVQEVPWPEHTSDQEAESSPDSTRAGPDAAPESIADAVESDTITSEHADNLPLSDTTFAVPETIVETATSPTSTAAPSPSSTSSVVPPQPTDDDGDDGEKLEL